MTARPHPMLEQLAGDLGLAEWEWAEAAGAIDPRREPEPLIKTATGWRRLRRPKGDDRQ